MREMVGGGGGRRKKAAMRLGAISVLLISLDYFKGSHPAALSQQQSAHHAALYYLNLKC